MPRHGVRAVLLLAAVALPAGCRGGGSGGGGGIASSATTTTTITAAAITTTSASSTSRSAPLSKADFVTQADAICRDTTSQINALPAPSPTAGPTEAAIYIQATLNVLDPALQRLANLPAAPSDATVLQQNLIAPTRVEDAAAHAFLNAVHADQGNATAAQQALDTFSAAAVDPDQAAHDQALSGFGFKACATTTTAPG